MTTSAEHLNTQVHAAHAAFARARDVPPRQRGQWLHAVADALDQRAGTLLPLAQAETHLDEARLRGELKRTGFQLRLLADEIAAGEHLSATIDHADPDWGMGPRPDLRRVHQPLGVVGVFGASNFPFAFSVIGGDSASALAAGCAVVHKVHEGHPQLGRRTAEIVIAALRQAGAPDGLFAAVTGREAGLGLVDHPLVQAIGFTGSLAGGRALFDRAQQRPVPIPFFGELGSLNPVFVTKAAWAARREEIIAGFAASFTLGVGQFCTKPGLLLVPEPDSAALATLLQAAVSAHPPARMLNPALREGYASTLAQASALPGVAVLVPGSDAEAPHPTVLITSAQAVQEHPAILHLEIFGPASVVVHYRDERELESVAALLDGQLTSTLHAQADESPQPLLALLQARSGRVLWNGWPTGVTVSYAQHHGGPYPASTAAATTSVGTAAISRFLRPVAFQSFPDARLPPALQDANPWQIARRVNGCWQPAAAL